MQKVESDNGVLITFREGYLHITHPENFVILPEDIDGLWLNLAEACKAHKCNRVLSEGNLNISKLKAFDAYKSGSQAGEIRGLRLACLFPNLKPDNQSDFFKTVAANRGAKVEFFDDRAAALRWLGVKNDV